MTVDPDGLVLWMLLMVAAGFAFGFMSGALRERDRTADVLRRQRQFVADAARYRWLRSTTNAFTHSDGRRIDVRLNPDLFDETIDAALQAPADGAGGER